MAEIPLVIPGEDVLADWGNLIRDRTVMRYDSQGVLDVSIPSPNTGDLAYVTDEQAVKVFTGTWVTLALQINGEFLPLAGGVMAGDIDLAGFDIENVRNVRNDGALTLSATPPGVGGDLTLTHNDSAGSSSRRVLFQGATSDIRFYAVDGTTIVLFWDQSQGRWRISTNLDFQGLGKIEALLDPTAPQDAATKAYVDAGPSATAWVPTFTGVSIGNGTLVASFVQVGKLCYFRFNLVFGSTTIIGNANVGFGNMPAAAGGYGVSRSLLGAALYRDATGTSYGHVRLENPTGLRGVVSVGNLPFVGESAVNGTTPITFAADALWTFQGVYEVA